MCACVWMRVHVWVCARVHGCTSINTLIRHNYQYINYHVTRFFIK